MTGDTVHPPAAYTLRSLRQVLGLSRHAIGRLVDLGFVAPSRGAAGAYEFSFRDVVLLRSAHELRSAGIATRQILRALKRLKEALPADVPLQGLRVTAAGDRVAVRSAESLGDAPWEAESGQYVLDFNVAPAQGTVSFIADRSRTAPVVAQPDIDALFATAESLEDNDALAAEKAYRSLLSLAPAHAHSYLNLGFMLCESQRCAEAIALYDDAVKHCAEDPLVHYNRAVALESLGRAGEALESYEQCLRLQPDLEDAHQNAALLYAQSGQPQMAIRHFSAYRRLQRPRT